jgi:hypothetical protein
VHMRQAAKAPNNHMHSDSKKCRSFVALLFAAGDVKRCYDFRCQEVVSAFVGSVFSRIRMPSEEAEPVRDDG